MTASTGRIELLFKFGVDGNGISGMSLVGMHEPDMAARPDHVLCEWFPRCES